MNEAYPTYPAVNFVSEAGGRRTLRNLLPRSLYLLIPLLFFSTHGSVPILMASGNNDYITGSGVSAIATLAGMAIVGCVVLVCASVMQPYWKMLLMSFVRSPLVAFLPLLALASTVWSQDPLGTFRKGLWLLVCTFFAFYLAKAMSPQQLVRLLMFVGAVAAVSSVLLCVALPVYGVDHVGGQNLGSWQGIYPQKNSCGIGLLYLLTPVFLPTTASGVKRSHRLLYAMVVLFMIGMSQSRTAWGITLLYIALMASLRLIGKFPRLQSVLLVAIGLILVGGVAWVLYSNADQIIELMGRDKTLSGRTEIWAAAMQSVWKHPLLGYGYNGFWIGFKGEAINVLVAVRFSLTHAHNGFLNLWLELGLVGLAGFAAMLIPAVKNAVISFGPRRSPFVDWYMGLIFLTLLFNIDESFLLRNMDLQWILFVVACLGLADAARATLTARKEWEYSMAAAM